MTMYDDLIDLFATYPLEKIEANNGEILKKHFSVKTIDDLAKLEGYTDNFSPIKECKGTLDRIIAKKDVARARQVTECLEHLHLHNGKRQTRSVEILRDLIKHSIYESAWTPQERETFDQKYEAIVDWRRYFLSYTNRDAKVMNNTFRELIEFAYTPTPEEWNTKNLLARVITELFTKSQAFGFFDRNDIKSGDDIGNDVRYYCRRCWAFVQIMEDASFSTPPHGGLNWCFEEFKEFRDSAAHLEALAGHNGAKRYHFVITEDSVENLSPIDPEPDYTPWFDHARKVHSESLRNKSYVEARAIIREIASQIKNLRGEVIADLLH